MSIDKYSWNMMVSSKQFSEEKQYWIEKLKGLTLRRLPSDFARDLPIGYESAQQSIVLPDSCTQRLTAISGNSKLAQYIIGVAAVQLLLQKYTRQPDIAVAMPPFATAGAMEAVSDWVYLLRTQVVEQETSRQFLQASRETVSEARKHRNLPLQAVVDLVESEQDTAEWSRCPVLVWCEELHVTPDLLQMQADVSISFRMDPERVEMRLTYNARLYTSGTIERMGQHLATLLQTMIERPDDTLADFDMLSEAEKTQLLVDFNNTQADYPRDRTIIDLFEAQVEQTPDQTAILFGEQRLSYQEVNARANQMARVLRAKGVQADDIVAVMVHRSLEMMITLLAVLKAGGAYLPIAPSLPEDRIRYILSDSQAKLLITQEEQRGTVTFDGLTILVEDPLLRVGDSANLERVHDVQHIAYVIYTSGTTGRPKGTLIEHHSLVNRLHWMQKCYPISKGDVILQKTPFTFDVSVWELFWWSFTGASVAFLEVDGEKDPASIVAAIQQHGVTTMHFVPSMLHVFLEYLEEFKNKNDLTSLRQVFASGEALNPQQVMRFMRFFAGTDTRLINLYGPTEATIDVTYFNCYGQESFDVIPIGKPIDNTSLYILDENRKLLPLGAEGELYLAGDGLARGYLNKPELTSEKFVPNPFVAGTRMYRTGDLARWRDDGNVEYLGRIDHQVKIRGYRIELGEIESQLLKKEAVKETVVMARTDEQGSPYLCAYVVSKSPLQAHDLQAQLAETLPDYMVPPTFVFLREMPLSTHGKVDRHALPEPGRAVATAAYVEPRNELELRMARLWQEVLGAEGIGIDQSFFDLGGNSLKAILLLTKVHQEFGVDIRLGQMFKMPTVRQLVAFLEGAVQSEYQRVGRAEEKAYYPLSSAQKGLLVQESYQELGTTYNMPRILLAEGVLDADRLEAIMRTLIERHESLRTSYHFRNGEFVQQIHPTFEFTVPVRDAEESDIRRCVDEFIRPFDLQTAPLVRLELLRITTERHVVLFDMHHSIADGVSLDMFLQEFERLYRGEELPEREIQYKDFAEWQNSAAQQENIRKQERFWLETLSGELPVLDLPLDYTRPAVKSFEGDEISFSIDSALVSRLKSLMVETGTTMFMVLLAAYNVLLAKYSGQEDHLVGTPIAGRPHGDLQEVMGMFVNILVMRNRPAGTKTFRAFLEEVREQALQAFENQDYQFEELVGALNVRRDWSRNPLFDTMFIMQNGAVMPELLLDGLRFTPYEFEHRTSKFDLKLEAFETETGIDFNLEYSTRLFKLSTVEQIAQRFVQLLHEVVDQPNRSLYELETLSTEEQRARRKVQADAALIAELREHLANELPAYMVPAHLVVLDAMPLSQNGKLDLQALPAPPAITIEDATYVAPRTSVEATLVNLWREVLGVEGIGIDHHFFELGGHSLRAVMLASKIHQQLQVEFPIRDLFRSPTIRQQAEYIRAAEKSFYQGIEPVAEKDYYVVSSAQKRLFIIDKFGEPNIAYNMPMAAWLEGHLDIKQLEDVFQTLVRRHEVFRTSFHLIDDQLMQQVHREVDFTLTVQVAAESEVETLFAEFVRPFDLYASPLLRANVVQVLPEKHLLMIDMHHIISDGVSMDILMQEVQLLFAGKELPELRFQYKDYAEWQHTQAELGTLQKQQDYWLERLAGDVPVLQMPTDFPRPAVQSFEGDTITVELPAEQSTALYQLAKTTESTLFMVLLAAYNVLLAKYSGQADIIVGTPVAGRSHADLQRIVGKFVNTLALRNYPQPGKTFRAFLEEVKEHALEAFENQDCQFEELLDSLNWQRDWSRNPLFDTMFIVQNAQTTTEAHLDGVSLSRYDFNGKQAKFDLKLEVVEDGSTLQLELEFCTKLFTKATAERMLRHYCNILADIANSIDVEIGELDNRSADEYPARRVANEIAATSVQTEASVFEQLRTYLQQELPAYMVPRHYVELEQIPLTSNGKVDRAALPEPDWNLDLGGRYEPPSNEVEEQIAATWSEVLGTRQVGVTDSFFDVGGNSIKIIALGAKISTRFGVDVPPIVLARTATIREQAEYVAEQIALSDETQAEATPITLMNGHFQKNMFVFPPIGGYAIAYNGLAKRVQNTSFYGFDFIEQEEQRIERYIQMIRTVQPQGPYVLAGFSAGGNLAYEVTAELSRRGAAVSDLILMDTRSAYEPSMLPLTEEQLEQAAQDVRNFLQTNPDVGDHIADQDRLVQEAVSKVASYGRYLSSLSHQGVVDTTIHLIHAESTGEKNWDSLSTQPVLHYQGAGPHEAMIEQPEFLERNANILNQILQRVNG